MNLYGVEKISHITGVEPLGKKWPILIQKHKILLVQTIPFELRDLNPKIINHQEKRLFSICGPIVEPVAVLLKLIEHKLECKDKKGVGDF